MTKDFATAFATSWIDGWNSHELEKILSHYSEECTIDSPIAVKLYPESLGVVVGKVKSGNIGQSDWKEARI